MGSVLQKSRDLHQLLSLSGIDSRTRDIVKNCGPRGVSRWIYHQYLRIEQ
ncbi:hypothetical protein Bca4012_098590 [Brassica carinata]